MESSIIIETNQAMAVKNHLIDYGTAISQDTNGLQISNSKWKTKLPRSIPLEVGDTIQYESSMIKSRGVSDSGIELIGRSNGNAELVDNKIKFETGYYINNNWLNNLMLPRGLATLREHSSLLPDSSPSTQSIRNHEFLDEYYTYNVCLNKVLSPGTPVYSNFQSIWWKDYGGPDITSHTKWEKNGTPFLSIPANQKSKLNSAGTEMDFGFSNANPTATNNMLHYVPDDTRLYIGPSDWLGPYNNGYTTEFQQTIPGTYTKIFDIITTEAEIEAKLGFNSPIVIGKNITESLSNPNLDDNVFVIPKIIDYRNDLTVNTGLLSLKNYFNTENSLQVIDETCKCLPTSFGKMLYDVQNGVDGANFSINDDILTATGKPLASQQQRIKYFWNSIASGDYKRTRASSNLYSNLINSKNIGGMILAGIAEDFSNICAYTGDVKPETNWTISGVTPESSPGYPEHGPYNFGEQIVIQDDLTPISVAYTSADIAKSTNRLLVKSFVETDYATLATPTTSDRYLNLNKNTVIFTNLVANSNNFIMLKKVIEDLEKPSENTINIDYENQDFLDSLYFTFELGNLDDQLSTSVYNIKNTLTSTKSYTYPRVEKGIPIPVSLSNVNIITSNAYPISVRPTNIPTGYFDNLVQGFYRLPLMAGLFCDESNIKIHTEGTGAAKRVITQLEDLRSNHMYGFDFYSRYNENRIPKSGNLILPNASTNITSLNFNFKDKDGKYFDDSQIKSLGLGIVVAFKRVNVVGQPGTFADVPFIGFVCREQITSKDKYTIPLPSVGEFFGIPRALGNNSLSYTASWERKAKYDNRSTCLVEAKVINGGNWDGDASPTPIIAKIEGDSWDIEPTVALDVFVKKYDPGSTPFKYYQVIKNITITNNGSHLNGNPSIVFYRNAADITAEKPIKRSQWEVYPDIELILGAFKNSYDQGTIENNQPNFPYIMCGANAITCQFDETQSRMGFSKFHTLMKEGQNTNGLQRYYDGSMFFNTDAPIITPDTQSSNDVIKINVRKTYSNSCRSGFTEAIPESNPEKQIFPISNNAIRSKGILSAISGIGLLNIYVGKKDGGWLKVNSANKFTYENTLLDKLGFNINQLLPKFGNQNTFFNRGLHNKYVLSLNNSLNMYTDMVSPFTTNALVSSDLNQSINTNNINYLMGSLDGNNLLEKSLIQTSDSLIALNLPSKFSYTHLLIFSNVIPKYNYIGSSAINNIPCIGSIGRSYEIGDVIYGVTPGIPYIVDKNYILSEIDIDLRTEIGQDAPIDSGSTVIIKITKRKPIPQIETPSQKKDNKSA